MKFQRLKFPNVPIQTEKSCKTTNVATERTLTLRNQTGSTQVWSLNDSKRRQSEIQRHETNLTANDIEDDNISRSKITTSQIEERLVRDGITNDFYMPLSSTIDLK